MTKQYPERDPSGPEGDRTTRYATMDSTRLARPEGCCDMTVYLCEDYGLG